MGEARSMTRAELLERVRQLEAQAADETKLRRLLAELEVWREESRQQTEHLLEIQNQLALSGQRYADLYDQAPVGYITHDLNGIIEEANLQAASVLGIMPDALRGKPLLVFVAKADRDKFLQYILRCRRGDDRASTEMVLQRRPQDVGVPVQVVTRCIPRPQGVPVFHTALIDLSERHRAEAERRELLLNEQAARAASEAKDHFLAVLSHELRTPLTPIVAALTALEKHPGLPADVRPTLELIRRNLRMETALIDDLLDVTRIARDKLQLRREAVDLHGVIGDVIRACEHDAREKALSIATELDANARHVDGDPIRLQQVIWNLLRNAIKFTPASGRVAVRTRNEPGGRAGDAILIEVVDTGRGIDPRLLPRLFRPFEQAAAEAGHRTGLGLGLSIARGLVEAHGGSIRAHSDGEGRGATFSVRLPTVPAPRPPARPVEPAEPAEPRPAGRPLRILLVEDHADTARMMAQLLRAEGHQVMVAGSCDEARKRLSSPIDLIISDIGLPDGTGYDVIREARAHGPVPGIALSGYGAEADIALARNAGFEHHITKPVDFNRLLATIDELAAQV